MAQLRRCGGLAVVVVLGLAQLAASTGCGSSKPVVFPEDTSRQNLQRIGVAYAQAAVQFRRPPQKRDDLLVALQGEPGQPSPADILKSPNDGEEYVIVWGVNFRELGIKRGNVDVVIAYEKRGRDGKRYVLKPPTQVIEMTDAEFKAASFPPGHTPEL